VSVVCCQVEVSATGWSLVQRSPIECGVSKKCDREASKKRGGLGPQGAVEPLKKLRSVNESNISEMSNCKFSEHDITTTWSIIHVSSTSTIYVSTH
jgi:hypothetical protein